MSTSRSASGASALSMTLLISLTSLMSCSPQGAEPNPVSTSVQLASASQEVIYGADTRVEVYQASDALAEKARRSIFAMISAQAIDMSDPSDVGLFADTLGSSYGLCPDQRFRDQPTASSCSATLIDDDLLVTAGHCIGSQAECRAQRFVLGYYMEQEGLAPLSASDVFLCEELVLSYDDGEVDYAFIKLDRPVPITQGEPSPVRRTRLPLSEGDPLILMGFPSGLPLKIDDGGFVSDPRSANNDYFRATVDAFAGNSGSGVFNEAGEQVGILVRGEQDYIQEGLCVVVNELSIDRGIGDSAEEITYLHRGLSALCQSGYQSERLCGEAPLGGLCSPCDDERPCQAGLSCGRFTSFDTALTFCAPTCVTSDECPSGHSCLSGQCEPNVSRLCNAEGSAVDGVDVCGRVLGVIEECSQESYCRRGECLLRGEGDLCASATYIEPVSQSLRGTLLEGYVNSLSGRCAGDGPERFYTFTLDQANHLTALSEGFDTVMYLFSGADCDPSQELVCDDDGHPSARFGSMLDLDLAPGVYTLALDSFSPETVGDYELSIQFCDEGCSLGQTRCEAGGLVSVCEQPPGASCRGWSPPFECPEQLTCFEGQCVTPSPGDTCSAQLPLTAPYPPSLTGEITNRYSVIHQPLCLPPSALIGDVNYRLILDYDARVTLTYGFGLIGSLSIRSACGALGVELSCARLNSDAPPFQVDLQAGEYTLTVSGTAQESTYEIALQVEPFCIDECEEGAQRCSNDNQGLERCTIGEEGCAVWSDDRQCTGPGGCLAGLCIDECFHECELGPDECVNLEERRGCMIDEQGCRLWRALEPCRSGELCTEDGRCVSETPEAGVEAGVMAGVSAGVEAGVIAVEGGDSSPEPSPWVGRARPREVEIPERARGGCDQRPEPLTPLFALLGFGSVSLYWRRRALLARLLSI